MNYTLGADPSSSAGVGLNLLIPTDFDTAKVSLQKYIELTRFTGKIIILTPEAWVYVGLGGSNITVFLNRYVQASRYIKRPLDGMSLPAYQSYMVNDMKWYNSATANKYLNDLLECIKQGVIPESIKSPWGNTPGGGGLFDISANLGKATGEALAKTLQPVFWILLAGIAVYGVSGSIAPALAKKFSK